MRKLASILSALVILVSSMGTTVALHYCGKSLQDVAILGNANPCGGMEMPPGCCHDEKVQIKSDNYNVVQQIAAAGFVPFLIHEMAFPVFDFTQHFQNAESRFLSHLDRPHPPDGQDIVILVQSILI